VPLPGYGFRDFQHDGMQFVLRFQEKGGRAGNPSSSRSGNPGVIGWHRGEVGSPLFPTGDGKTKR
jgi:hypothetical protein